jgi:hypothetical protein
MPADDDAWTRAVSQEGDLLVDQSAFGSGSSGRMNVGRRTCQHEPDPHTRTCECRPKLRERPGMCRVEVEVASRAAAGVFTRRVPRMSEGHAQNPAEARPAVFGKRGGGCGSHADSYGAKER